MKKVFSVKKWPPELALKEIELENVPFWVQIRGIPLGLASLDNIQRITKEAGKFLALEDPGQAHTEKPLFRGCWIRRDLNRDTWVEFRYERLQDFCYQCGRIGHINTKCNFKMSVRDVVAPARVVCLEIGERRQAGAVCGFGLSPAQNQGNKRVSTSQGQDITQANDSGEASATQGQGQKKWRRMMRVDGEDFPSSPDANEEMSAQAAASVWGVKRGVDSQGMMLSQAPQKKFKGPGTEENSQGRLAELWMSMSFKEGCLMICGEDFNEYIWDHEKSGKVKLLYNRPRFLEEFMSSSQLLDLGFHGLAFTWRANSNMDGPKGRKMFRFEAFWAKDEECKDLVRNCWECRHQGNYVHKWGRQLVEHHFASVFSSEGDRNWGSLLDCINPMISNDMNEALTAPITDDEIIEAALKIGGLKAPSPDGFQGIFLSNLLGDSLIQDSTSTGTLNETHIVLIPKVPSLEHVTQFRPISLCNYSYKILSKILVNRLKILLPTIISPSQNAFVAVMEKMGFCSRWRSLIRGCVSSVKFDVLLNGQAGSTFAPSRGLRQGDPLSPYLFILGRLDGVKIGVSGPVISHLFFADDTLLFLRADEKNCRNLSNLLTRFCVALGQKVNLMKSSVFFGANIPNAIAAHLGNTLGMAVVSNPGTYLGVPAIWGRTKKHGLAYVKGRIMEKMQGWKQSTLSQVRKEVLIKAVVQAIPAYPMSIFKFPTVVCHELDDLVSGF
ncbi:hypothetical protein D8674_030609 [Pyrus ussuriensis x Pyrus communis]|uniref:CCHC-type domain-containing protein n=1 Tax=Pyrus ussuriensis x Pyrus communis TaxID=2448454 RepID=A0A5N5EW19_9ROSA|nr:hypothetical protein D8674_030609 [Pyrus ussuriensis x Pyrus communis]